MLSLDDDAPEFQTTGSSKPRKTTSANSLVWVGKPDGSWSQVAKSSLLGKPVPAPLSAAEVLPIHIPSVDWLRPRVPHMTLTDLHHLQGYVTAAIAAHQENTENE